MKKIVIHSCAECPYLLLDQSTTALHSMCTINYYKHGMVQFITDTNKISEDCILQDNE
jgi:hypothetical protein